MKWVDEGQKAMLDVFFRGATPPTNFQFRLFLNSLAGGITDPSSDDATTDLTGEPSGNGYAAQQLDRNSTDWPTLDLQTNERGYRVHSVEMNFTATAPLTPVRYVVMTNTTGAGPIYSWAKFAQTRIADVGSPIRVTFHVKQKE